METIFITHPSFYQHEMGAGHPESPLRLQAVQKHLAQTGLTNMLHEMTALKAKEEDLSRVHSLHHIATMQQYAPETGYFSIDSDTVLNPHTLEAAYYAAGAGILAVDQVMAGHAQRAFCAVRPPGHHACFDQAMGFCFFNNVAVAAAYAIERYQLDQVVIVDFDVHHGNGTEDIFAHQDQVQMFGFYQHPFYPHARHLPEAPNMYNEAVPAGTESTAIRDLVTQSWLPRLRQLKPKLLFFSAGFDAHTEDAMAQMHLTEADFAWITDQVMQATAISTHGRVISMLEGGYALDALARSVAAHIKVLAGLATK